MRIALLSDIHGNLAALEAVVADLRPRGVDQIVNLGDLVSGPLLPRETAEYLQAQGWLTIAGNHERQLLTLAPGERGASDEYAHSCLSERELDWFRTFPATFQLDPEIFLCHGTPGSDDEYFLESVDGPKTRLASRAEIESRLASRAEIESRLASRAKIESRLASRAEIEPRLGAQAAAVVACGHTHVPRSVRNASGQLLVNPGSVGLPAFFHDVPTLHSVENGSPDARYAILERGSDGWTVQHLTVPYDHHAMADLAQKRDRPDWERALRSGYVT